jgi:transposase-like protein
MIDYKELRKTSPEAARQAVIEYLKSDGGNVSATARLFGINRCVVYDILRKWSAGDLRDRPRTPHHQPNKTAPEIEEQVIAAKNKTRLGPQRLSRYLRKYEQLSVPAGTIRHILRRNKHKLTGPLHRRRKPQQDRPFVDWYSAQPFEIVQVDLKHIRDQKALSKEQIIHLDQYFIPNYQWSALDVNSRFKLIAYSREKSWTNGLCFYLWTISWLRSNGVQTEIVFTVDHGEEFGGKSWFKLTELRKLLRGLGCRVIQNHKGHCEENAHVERSHRTDDDEFYVPRASHIRSEQDLLAEALGYIYYYNNVREHSSLDYKTPVEYLKQQLPDIDDHIRTVIPIMLDRVAVAMGPWSGYNVLAQHRFALRKSRACPIRIVLLSRAGVSKSRRCVADRWPRPALSECSTVADRAGRQ